MVPMRAPSRLDLQAIQDFPEKPAPAGIVVLAGLDLQVIQVFPEEQVLMGLQVLLDIAELEPLGTRDTREPRA